MDNNPDTSMPEPSKPEPSKPEPSKPEPSSSEPSGPESETKPGFFQVTLSVLAAALGVQTNANRERDFSQSSPMPYIVGGIIFTVVFVLSLIGIVMLVLPD